MGPMLWLEWATAYIVLDVNVHSVFDKKCNQLRRTCIMQQGSARLC
jgi:hypothetical protein